MRLLPLFFLLAPLNGLLAQAIPSELFPGIEFDSVLQDSYATGEALPLRGEITDPDKEDGRILFQFVPQAGGEALQAVFDLDGNRFAGYQIFNHAQAGRYDLQLFSGGPGETSLPFVGEFKDLEIVQGEGIISLPVDYFSGIDLGQTFPTEAVTGSEVWLSGDVTDPELANGQILFSFGNLSGGEDVQVFINLNGSAFELSHLFEHEQAGDYELEVFLGGPAPATLEFRGRFRFAANQGSGTIMLPTQYFPGVVMSRPSPTALEVIRLFEFQERLRAM